MGYKYDTGFVLCLVHVMNCQAVLFCPHAKWYLMLDTAVVIVSVDFSGILLLQRCRLTEEDMRE